MKLIIEIECDPKDNSAFDFAILRGLEDIAGEVRDTADGKWSMKFLFGDVVIAEYQSEDNE